MSVPGTPNTDYQPLSFDQAIQFYWDAPTGSSVTEYRLTLNYDGGSLVYTPAAADVTFIATGLTNNVTYSATLEARNANGYSAIPGTYRDWQPGIGIPGAPSTVTATLVGATNAILSWTPPAVSPTAPIYWYVIEAYSTSNPLPIASYSANGLTQSNYFITGLNSNLAYYFNVSAVNYPDYSLAVRTSTIQYLAPFQPNYLPGMSMWLDGRDPLNTGTAPANGTSITTWFDKSGQGYNATSAGTTPTYSSTEQTVNVFSSNSFYTTTYSASLSNESIFFVFKMTNANQTSLLGPASPPTGGRSVYVWTAPMWLEAGLASVGGYTTTTSNSVTYCNMLLGSLTINNNTWSAFINSGNQRVSATSGNPTAGKTTNLGYFQYTYELNIYNRPLTPFDSQKVEGYLAWKWGIQSNLPTSHPFRTAAPYSNSVFAPTSFSSLQLWLDGSDPLGTGTAPANGTTFTTWSDKSGKNNNAAIYSGAPLSYSNNAINTYSAPYMSNSAGSSQLRAAIASNTFTNSFQAFAVFKVTTQVGNTTILTRGTNNKPGPWDLSQQGRLVGDANNFNSSNASFNLQGVTSNCLFVYGSTSNQWNEYVFGTLCNTFNWSPVYWGDPAPYVYIGERADGNHNFIGYYGEILLYNRVLSGPDRQTVEGYLAWKWGLQSNLPGTHPYYDNNPAVLPPTLFTPSNFNSLSLWLDASDSNTFTYSGLNITAWADKSGSSNNMLYNTGSYATRTTDAGKTVVQFPNATGQYYSALTNTYTTNLFTLFYVLKKTNTSYSQAMSVGGVFPAYEYDYGGGPGLIWGGPSPAGSGGNGYFVVNGSRNTINSGTYTTYHIGRGTGSGGTGTVRVGGVYGTICEILVYNRKAQLTELQ